jgi:hypothetical protein
MNIKIPTEGIHLDTDIDGHTHFDNLDIAGYYSLKQKVMNAVPPFDFPCLDDNFVSFRDKYRFRSLRSKRGLSYSDPRAPKRRKLQKIDF